jgi:hypothetical protein
MTNTWGEFLQQRVARGDGGDDRINAGLLHELRNFAPLRFLHDGDHGAVIAGASGAAGTMQIRLVLDGRIGVDDQRDVIDMNAASGDVGGDKHHCSAFGERGQVAHAHVLGEVAVHLDCRHTAGIELLGEGLGPVLGAGEHDGTTRRRGEINQYRQTIGGSDVEHVMGHGVDR